MMKYEKPEMISEELLIEDAILSSNVETPNSIGDSKTANVTIGWGDLFK